MGSVSARNKSSQKAPQDQIDRSLAIMAARKSFIATAMNMGWQLAITVIVPVIIGVKLDDHFHTAPSYTLAALILAAGGAVWVVMSTLKQVSRDQLAEENKGKKA